MSLEWVSADQYVLRGVVTFDNAANVERDGRKLLEAEFQQGMDHIELDLSELTQGDSSTLSVFLSWLRLALQHNAKFCLSNIPGELQAIAKVCGIDKVLEEASCRAEG